MGGGKWPLANSPIEREELLSTRQATAPETVPVAMSDQSATPVVKARKRRHLKKPALSAREVRFCVLWVELGNATQCYIDAGMPVKTDRVATAKAASDLFRKPDISAFIRNLQTAAAEAAKVTVNGIATGLQRSANKDLRKLYDHRGRLKLPHEWPDEVAAFVEGVESEEIFETVTRIDPDTGKPVRCKELVGYVRKVKTTNRTESQKVLAQWKRMIGQDADAGKPPPAPLVVGGEASPEAL